tara:strand:+ start:419 stop:727 length:309 start_codon:yes stop_codon:yes gene_type:complete
MQLSQIQISENLSKEQAIMYYLFVDEQLLCAWWDYLDCWNYKDSQLDFENSPELKKKMDEIMKVVNYWECILDQLKCVITYQDIEEYVTNNPHVTKSYLFVR